MIIKLAVALSVLFIVSGCASMGNQQCYRWQGQYVPVYVKNRGTVMKYRRVCKEWGCKAGYVKNKKGHCEKLKK